MNFLPDDRSFLLRVTRIHAWLVAVACLKIAMGAIAQNPSVGGEWTPLFNWPDTAIHGMMLPTGKVLTFGNNGRAPVWWDPVGSTFGSTPNLSYIPYCGGHTFAADGRLLEISGHIQPLVGPPDASLYDAELNAWTRLPDMNAGRWYGTAVTLPDGGLLALAGSIGNGDGGNELPQILKTDGTWRDLTGALKALPLYPRTHVAPNGKVFVSGPNPTTLYLDVSGNGSWSTVGERTFGLRAYGSSVQYADGKIMSLGGADPPTATAEVIDLNAANPAWRAVQSMAYKRRNLNATLLPDGTLLASGGSSEPGANNASGAVMTAENWDPGTERWTTWSAMNHYRGYHSIAVLLPDARVLVGGGNNYKNAQVFSPPYLFKGSRPAITSAPPSVLYGETFFVGTSNAANIAKVNWIRLTATTHAINMNQRINHLSFSQASGGLNLTAPPNPNLCPPGDHMLFILNGNGVPSVASMIRITASAFQFSASNYNVNEGVGTATITVNRVGTPTGIAYVDFATSNGSASAPSDYSSTTGTLQFADGQTSKNFGVPIVNDPNVESSETVNLVLRNARGNTALRPRSNAVLTIVDNDGTTPRLMVSPASLDFGNVSEGTTAEASFLVSNTGVGMLNGTATVGVGPFVIESGSPFSLAASGSTNLILTFTPNSEDTASNNVVFASNGGNSTNPVAGIGIIPMRVLRVITTNGTAGEAVTVPLEFSSLGDENALNFSLIFDTNVLSFVDAADVQLGACAATATLEVDANESVSGHLGIGIALPAGTLFSQGACQIATVTFTAAAVLNVTPTVVEFGDSPMAREVLDGGSNLLTTSYSNAVVTVSPTPPATPTVSIAASDPAASEPGADKGAFTVTRDSAPNTPLTVSYVVGGTATDDSDYSHLPGSVTIPPNESGASIPINPLDDALKECPETAIVTLAPSITYFIGSSSNAMVTINDNDLPTVKVTAPDANAAETGSNNGSFKISRTGCKDVPLTVFYNLSGTATHGSDYTLTPAKAASVVVPAGSSSKVLKVNPINDTRHESKETVILSLVPDPAYNIISPSNSTVSITSNE